MERLSDSVIEKLKHGDLIHLIRDGRHQEFKFVGLMPGNKRYIIVSAGETLKHIYTMSNAALEWFTGERDDVFIGEELIEYFESEIDFAKSVYLDK